MGGRRLKLTREAEIINRMLKQRMLMRDIADILGVTVSLVSATKQRFDLPRAKEEGEVNGPETGFNKRIID